MRPFKTKEELAAVLSGLWDRILATPRAVEPLSRTRLRARFRFPDMLQGSHCQSGGEAAVSDGGPIIDSGDEPHTAGKRRRHGGAAFAVHGKVFLRRTGPVCRCPVGCLYNEGVGTGGIGSEVIARATMAGPGPLIAPPLRIAAPECLIPYARNIENAMLPNRAEVARRIEEMMG